MASASSLPRILVANSLGVLEKRALISIMPMVTANRFLIDFCDDPGTKDALQFLMTREITQESPKNGEAAQSEELKQAFDETEGQVEMLQQVFEIFGKRAQAKTCEAIEGILEEGEEIIEEYKDSPALDAGLLAAGQAVEHYEIARTRR